MASTGGNAQMMAMGMDMSGMTDYTENGEGGGAHSERTSYMWTVELKAGSIVEHKFEPEIALASYNGFGTPGFDPDRMMHNLQVRYAIGGSNVKEDETNLIKVEFKNPNQAPVSFPLARLSKANGFHAAIGLEFSDLGGEDAEKENSLVFKLEQGTGPVNIVGYHIIDRIYDNRGESGSEASVDEEELAEEEEEVTKDTAPEEKKKIVAKRRINTNGDADASVAKKAKVQDAKAENGQAKNGDAVAAPGEEDADEEMKEAK